MKEVLEFKYSSDCYEAHNNKSFDLEFEESKPMLKGWLCDTFFKKQLEDHEYLEFCSDVAKLPVYNWQSEYYIDQQDTTQWSLYVKFDDSSEINVKGINCWPEDFSLLKEFLKKWGNHCCDEEVIC